MNLRPSPNPLRRPQASWRKERRRVRAVQRAHLRRIRRIAWRREAWVHRRGCIEGLLLVTSVLHEYGATVRAGGCVLAGPPPRDRSASEFVDLAMADRAAEWLTRHRHLLR